MATRWSHSTVLASAGWQIGVRCAFDEIDLGVLPRRKLRALDGRLGSGPIVRAGPLVVLDGLLGIGARGPLREPLSGLAAEMDNLRRQQGAHVVAIDIPSGIDGDSGEIHPGAVRAELTLTVGVPEARPARARRRQPRRPDRTDPARRTPAARRRRSAA